MLKVFLFDTKLGDMVAIADDNFLYLLEFLGRPKLNDNIKKLKLKLIKLKPELKIKSNIIFGITDPIKSIIHEIRCYFEGSLKEFKTPILLLGSDFQNLVWKELMCIPYGFTKSYKEQSINISNPTAIRAVAKANSSNQLAIIVPCHRVIGADGGLRGYSGGLDRKKWLINHEKEFYCI